METINGNLVFADLPLHTDSVTRQFRADWRDGDNTVIVQPADAPNRNSCWAGFRMNCFGEVSSARKIREQLPLRGAMKGVIDEWET
jgi:hypothetical protein